MKWTNRRWPATASVAWVAALPFMIECGGMGGQSGTDGSAVDRCDDTQSRAVPLDERLSDMDQTPRELLASVSSPVQMPGSWLANGRRTELSLEIGPEGSARETSFSTGIGTICQALLQIDTTVTLRSADGVVEIEVPAILSPLPSAAGVAVVRAAFPELPDGYVGPALWREDGDLARARLDAGVSTARAELELVVVFRSTAPVDLVAGVVQGGDVLGFWATDPEQALPGPSSAYAASGPLTSACEDVERYVPREPVEFTSYASAEDALEGITGTWLRCLDNAPSAHAGLQILPDGSWRHVGLDGSELVPLSGLEHEGFFMFHDTSMMNDLPGLFQVDFLPYGPRLDVLPHGRLSDADVDTPNNISLWASERALVFRSGVQSLPPTIYLPTGAPLRAAPPPRYSDGERAGAAACADNEQGIVSTVDETSARVTGDFVLCSGSLQGGPTTLRFGETAVELLRADGSLISGHEYTRDTSDGVRVSFAVTLNELEHRSWAVFVSRRPTKLWIRENGGTFENIAVFSAVP